MHQCCNFSRAADEVKNYNFHMMGHTLLLDLHYQLTDEEVDGFLKIFQCCWQLLGTEIGT